MTPAPWRDWLLEPAGLGEGRGHPEWFAGLARRALLGVSLVACGVRHRITEVEVYYHGEWHPDPFAHRDPIQKATGLWYFHRTGGAYRGGTFKGLDLTFGGPQASGGLLIRGLEPEGGPLIDGPSLCVDHLLAATGAESVSLLDRAIAGRPAWDADSPLHLGWESSLVDRPILSTARVGLSLNRSKVSDQATRFVMRRYRHLTEPRRIAKGKLHMVLALHADGATPEAIRGMTGCPRAAIERHIEDFEAGKSGPDFAAYVGLTLGPKHLAQLHGLWQARYG